MLQKKFFTLLFFSTLLFAEKLPFFFSGNEHFSERELYEALYFHKPYFYEFYLDDPAIDPKTLMLLKQTLEDYYKSKGFFHAKITPEQDAKRIVFAIEEGEPVLVASVYNDSELATEELIPFETGALFDAEKFTQSKEAIKFFYGEQNYCNPALEAKAWIDSELNKAFLFYKSRKNGSCIFGNIKVAPTQNIDEALLRSLLYLEQGAPFSLKDIDTSYRSLYSYEGISKATIQTQVDANNSVDVSVVVEENEKPIRLELGVGASSDEGLMALAGIKHRNFINNLKTLGLSARLTQVKQTLKTTYDMPLLDKNFFGAEAGYENEKFEGFKEYRVFATLYFKQKLLPHTFLESLVFDSSKTYDADFDALFEQKYLFVVSPKLEWNYDMRDKLLEPTKGYFLNAQAMGSVKGEVSDATYYKYMLEGGYIAPFLGSTLACKATLGSLNVYSGNIPASYRFFAGGMQSNRAYGYRKLGPTDEANNPLGSGSILEATAEYRFGIYKEVRGVVFSDNTFLGNHEIPDYDNGYFSAGVGLRYKTPIGPLAIDAGFDTQKPKEHYAFHFRIGESF